MELGLQGRTAIVGGASSGIGLAVAQALAAEGVRVAMLARTPDRLTDAAEAIGANALPLPVDLDVAGQIPVAVERAVEAFGGIDIVVNNSGGPPKGRFDDLDEAQWELAYNRSLMSAVRLTKAALPHLRASDQARVISITSTSIKQPIPGLLLSNSLRSALAGWSKTIADELGPEGITVNVVSPGRVDTARLAELHTAWGERDGLTLDEVRVREAAKIPLGRFADPVEIGHAVVFLASRAASYVTGHVMQVDGGLIRGLL
jgi:3-oxoacyl-[acyl-carrier protein] reductase